MDEVTIQRSGKKVLCQYAAPSILTGSFVAGIGLDQGHSPSDLREIFTEPGDLTVRNTDGLYAEKTYSGYTFVDEIRDSPDGYVIILH